MAKGSKLSPRGRNCAAQAVCTRCGDKVLLGECCVSEISQGANARCLERPESETYSPKEETWPR
jgi:hypothetical protein